MAVLISFYTIVVPFSKVGGFEYLGEFVPDKVGQAVWYDRDLLCMRGGMGGGDAEFMAAPLETMGLQGIEETEAGLAWKDYCICTSVDGPWRGCCPWLDFDRKTGIASMGTCVDPTIAPNHSLIRDGTVRGTTLTMQWENSTLPAVGFVQIDDHQVGHNIGADGRFEMLLPSESVHRLNKGSSRHILRFHELAQGRHHELVFDLVDGEDIVLRVPAASG